MSKDVITKIEAEVNTLISLFEISYDIEDLVDSFNKVYYSFDTERKRFKIVGNKHFKAFDTLKQKEIVKQKKVQIYLLKKYSLDIMKEYEVKDLYKKVVKFCFYIELLKMYKTIENHNSILEEKYSNISDEEIEKFMSNN